MIEVRLLERLEAKKAQLDGLRPLPVAAVNRLRDEILIEWIYNSNAIEGSTVTLPETRLILETGLTIGGKTLREHFEVINHRDAIQYVEDLVQNTEPVTAFHVRQIHKLILTNIDNENAGSYRKTQVRIAGAPIIPPESWRITNLMAEWCNWVMNAENNLHPVAHAAQAHHRLVAIHPFVDGNGRTARLVMNLLLMRKGYPPTIILRANRGQYYSVLARADAGKPDALVNFIGRAVERSINLYLEACAPPSGAPEPGDEWMPLRDACVGTPYSQEYLSLLARMGRIEAIKRGRNWHTTRRAIKAYQDSL
ncbi:MAG: Fic family protein [Anaerolineae bacterium]|jgi:Fic family protein|nr:Fic family protein [Anaerolineae bacterium]